MLRPRGPARDAEVAFAQKMRGLWPKLRPTPQAKVPGQGLAPYVSANLLRDEHGRDALDLVHQARGQRDEMTVVAHLGAFAAPA